MILCICKGCLFIICAVLLCLWLWWNVRQLLKLIIIYHGLVTVVMSCTHYVKLVLFIPLLYSYETWISQDSDLQKLKLMKIMSMPIGSMQDDWKYMWAETRHQDQLHLLMTMKNLKFCKMVDIKYREPIESWFSYSIWSIL